MPDFELFTIIFFALVGIQLLFYIFQYFRFAFYKTRRLSDNDGITPVSIIVAARNEYENLKKIIPALLNQDHPNYEIIIVDDRSSDESYDYLMEMAQKYPKIQHVRVDETPYHVSTKKYALTLGIKRAQHEILLLTDADCIPANTDWARKMTAMHGDKKEFVLGFSQYKKNGGLLNAFIRFETLYTAIQYLSASLSGFPYMGVGRNLSYRRTFFLEKKGFQKHLRVISGDDDLYVNEHANRKNTTICKYKGAYTLSEPEKTWGDFYRQKKRHLSVGKKYKFSDKFRLFIQNISHIFCLILFILALSFTQDCFWILGAFGIRLVLQYVVFVISSVKLGIKFDLWLLPLFDFAYIIYYMIIGSAAALNKRIEWK